MSALSMMQSALTQTAPAHRSRLSIVREALQRNRCMSGRDLALLIDVPTNHMRSLLSRDIEAGRVRVISGGRRSLPSSYEWTGLTVETPRIRSQIAWLEQLGYTVIPPKGEQQ